MIKKYSEEEKLKYVRGFKNSTLTICDYAKKMLIDAEDLKTWLKEYKKLPTFGAIKIVEVDKAETQSTAIAKAEMSESTTLGETKTIIAFDNGTIKLEVKEHFNKKLLQQLTEALVEC